MPRQRTTHILLFIVGLLLVANLIQPFAQPETVFAQGKSNAGDLAITGSGATAWVVKGGQVYYLKFETQFESIRIYGPEELEQ